MGAVESFKIALDAFRVMQDLAGSAASAELNRRIAEAYAAVTTAYADAIELREENVNLKRQLADDSEQRALREALSREGDVYWLRPPPPGHHDGPFCMLCSDVDHKLVTVTEFTTHDSKPEWRCRKCNQYVPRRM